MTAEVVFHRSDRPHERARKAWVHMGFVNDRFNTSAVLAEVFDIYQKLDTPNPECEHDFSVPIPNTTDLGCSKCGDVCKEIK